MGWQQKVPIDYYNQLRNEMRKWDFLKAVMECDRLAWDQYRLALNQTDREIEKAKRKYFTENRESLKKLYTTSFVSILMKTTY